MEDCHYCEGDNRYKPYPKVVCSSRHREGSFDIQLNMYALEEKNKELKHQEDVSKVFSELRK